MGNEELVRKIQQEADTGAYYELLYNQNRGLIYKMSNKYAAYADIEDLQQEAYIALRAAVEHYQEHAGAFSTYFCKVMCRHFVRYINGNRLLNVCSLDMPCGEDNDCTLLELLPGVDNIDEQVTDDTFMCQVADALWNSVDSLPVNQAQIIRSQYRDCHSCPDICSRLNISAVEYRREHRKAIQQLRKAGSRGILKEYADEYIYNRAIRSYNFNTSWESSTEHVAIKRLEREGY